MELQSQLLDSNPALKAEIDESIVLGSLMGYSMNLKHEIFGGGLGFDLSFSQPIDDTRKFVAIRLVFYGENNRFIVCRVESNFFSSIYVEESLEEVLEALQKVKEKM